MTSEPPPDASSPRPPDGVDWDAEEESAEARSGPRRLDARTRRRWWVLGTVAVVVASAMAVWFGLAASVGRVHWVNTGYDIVSGTEVDVRFDLRRDPSREVVCRLEAQEGSHAVVGRTDVTVAPSPTSPTRHVETVRTAAPAITGYVSQCWYADEEPRQG